MSSRYEYILPASAFADDAGSGAQPRSREGDYPSKKVQICIEALNGLSLIIVSAAKDATLSRLKKSVFSSSQVQTWLFG